MIILSPFFPHNQTMLPLRPTPLLERRREKRFLRWTLDLLSQQTSTHSRMGRRLFNWCGSHARHARLILIVILAWNAVNRVSCSVSLVSQSQVLIARSSLSSFFTKHQSHSSNLGLRYNNQNLGTLEIVTNKRKPDSIVWFFLLTLNTKAHLPSSLGERLNDRSLMPSSSSSSSPSLEREREGQCLYVSEDLGLTSEHWWQISRR